MATPPRNTGRDEKPACREECRVLKLQLPECLNSYNHERWGIRVDATLWHPNLSIDPSNKASWHTPVLTMAAFYRDFCPLQLYRI